MAFGFIRPHPTWSWFLFVLTLIIALAVILLPRTVHFGLERWLERQGPISVKIENVDFNPFSGTLVVHTLIAEREEAPGHIRWERASLNVGWWPLLEQHLRLESLELRDAIVTIRREPEALYIGGLKIGTGDSAGKPEGGQKGWQFGFENVDLYNVRVHYLEENFKKEILIQEAHIGSMAGWNPENTGELRARIKAAGGNLVLDGKARPFASQPDFNARLKVEAVHLDWLQPWLDKTSVTVQQALLFTDLSVNGRYLPGPQRLQVQLDGSARLEEVQARLRQLTLNGRNLSWEGSLEATAPRAEAPPRFFADGTLEGADLDLHHFERQLAIQTEKALVDLSFEVGTQEGTQETAFLLTLSGSTDRVSLSDSGRNLLLASWRDLQVESLHMEGTHSFSLAQLKVVDLRLLERPEEEPLPFYLQASRLEAAGLQVGGGQPFGAQSLKAQKLLALLLRTEKGIDLPPWSLPGQENASEKRVEEKRMPELHLGLLDIGQGSRVLIRDSSLQPPLRLDLDSLSVHVENLDTTEERETPAHFDITLEANGHPLSLKGEARVSEEELNTAVQVDLREWPVSMVQPYLGEEAVLENGLLSLDSRLDGVYELSTNLLNLKMDGSAQLTDVHGEIGGMRLQRLSLDWMGQAAVETILGSDVPAKVQPVITARGEVQAPRFGLVLPEAQLRLEGQTLRLQGDLAMGTDAVPKGSPFLLHAEGSLASLRAEDREKELDLASLQEIDLVGGRMEGPDAISAERVRISGVQLLKRPGETEAGGSYFLNAASATLEKAQTAGPGDLTVAEFKVRGLEGILVREANGDFPFGKWLPEDKGEKEKEPLRLRIGLLKIDGKSRLSYLDRSVEPFVDLELQPFNARVTDLNTTGDKPSPLEIDGKFARHSNLRLNGTILSLEDKPSMGLLLEVESLSLPKLTGYTEKLFGYRAQAGNLDLNAELDVQEGALSAETTWKLTKLNLDAIDSEKRKETNLFLGFSLKTAVSLLRDGNGAISLNIPVTGELTSPDFQFSNVIQKAVLKGIRSAALAYFSPLGLVAKLGKDLLLDKAMELRFKPVLFAPGESQLSAQNRRYLDEVAKRLQDRPQVTIVVCGVIVTEDIVALRPQNPSAEEMVALARSRGENVRNYLADQGIAPDRLIQCAPETDRSEDAEPRVEIGI